MKVNFTTKVNASIQCNNAEEAEIAQGFLADEGFAITDTICTKGTHEVFIHAEKITNVDKATISKTGAIKYE